MNIAAQHESSWHRGIISEIPGNKKIEVFFVDLGIKRVLNYRKIRRLDPTYTAAVTRVRKPFKYILVAFQK